MPAAGNRTSDDYSDWIGRTEVVHDDLARTQLLSAAATFDDPILTQPGAGAIAPLWQWFHFLPRAPQTRLSGDGHPERGDFMPPITLPRRMFAGSRMRFHAPLQSGQAATRAGVIRNVSVKTGKTGRLAFVTVAYTYTQHERLCIEEEQDIVYREPGAPLPPPVMQPWSDVADGVWTRDVRADSRLLFRFSALTFNAHRIHYDREYAMHEEGYPGLVVHGPLTAVLLANLVRQRSGRSITSFSFRGMAPLFDLTPFRLVAVPDGDTVTCEAIGPDARVAMQAIATLGDGVSGVSSETGDLPS